MNGVNFLVNGGLDMRLYKMTWVAGRKGWLKKFQGKMYSVSCRQLGTAETKEASYQKANAWWDEKLAELTRPEQENTDRILAKVEELVSLDAQAGALRGITDLLSELQGHKLSEAISERLAGIPAKVAEALAPVEPTQTVGVQVAKFQEGLRLAVQTKQIDISRYMAYKRDTDTFCSWFGADRPVKAIDENVTDDYFKFLMSRVASGEWSAYYAANIWGAFRMLVTRWAERKLLAAPANLRSRAYKIIKPVQTPPTFALEEVQALLSGCTEEQGERTKLYLLLMLNLGAYQSDLAELGQAEVDWEAGVITRARSKTGLKGQVVSYKLWPETLRLLQKYCAPSGPLVLLTARGKPLIQEGIREDRRISRTDNIKSAYARLCARLRVPLRPLKNLRKTSASLLSQHPSYKFFVDYFLAHSPRTVKERSYAVPSQAEFDEAVAWLGRQYGLN
jgi:integrase